MSDVMTLNEFTDWIRRRWDNPYNKLIDQRDQRYVFSMGLPGETGEVCELLKKEIRDGREIREDLKLELGDVLHYVTRIGLEYGWTLQDIAQGNIDKLTERDARRVYRGEELVP